MLLQSNKAKNSGVQLEKKTIRVAVLGSSLVGKTQIINRIVNSAFSWEYIPTEEIDKYKLVYDTKGDFAQEDYRLIEFWDYFPTDHEDLSRSEPERRGQELEQVVQNRQNRDQTGKDENKKSANEQKRLFNAFIFVFDASNWKLKDKQSFGVSKGDSENYSFEQAIKMCKAIHDKEATENISAKSQPKFTLKYFLGNKIDLTEPDSRKKEGAYRSISKAFEEYQEEAQLFEVSALTNQGIQDMFTSLIQEIILQNQCLEARAGRKHQGDGDRFAQIGSDIEDKDDQNDDEEQDSDSHSNKQESDYSSVDSNEQNQPSSRQLHPSKNQNGKNQKYPIASGELADKNIDQKKKIKLRELTQTEDSKIYKHSDTQVGQKVQGIFASMGQFFNFGQTDTIQTPQGQTAGGNREVTKKHQTRR